MSKTKSSRGSPAWPPALLSHTWGEGLISPWHVLISPWREGDVSRDAFDVCAGFQTQTMAQPPVFSSSAPAGAFGIPSVF